jgi:ABC-2 type transport system ATP-binding protein
MKAAISIKDFYKSFGSQQAVADLDFQVDKGEVMAFLGGNGSGKTTTIRCLLQIYQPDKGELLINGETYDNDVHNQLLGYLPEERGIYTKVKLMDVFNYFAKLRGIDKNTADKFIEDYFKKVDLWKHKDKKIDQLSSGMQQKAQIGLTIMHKPEILILDEPFKGLDPVNRQLFMDIFRELNQDNQSTILYSTHVVDEAQKMADKVVIIKNGKRAAYGTISDVRGQFGSDTINIEFTGKLPSDFKDSDLFTATVSNKTAELVPNEGVSADKILSALSKMNIGLVKFAVDKPSLNEVFIRIANQNKHESQ